MLAAILKAAAGVTGAAAGWVVCVDDDHIEVRAVVGDAPPSLLGTDIPFGSGAIGYVVASGQPVALTSPAGEQREADGLAAALGRTAGSVLCVPCEAEDQIVGAIELVDKSGGGSFSFDDVELATLLAGVAGVALAAGGHAAGRAPVPPSPAALADGLARLAADAPARYLAVVEVVAGLLKDDGR